MQNELEVLKNVVREVPLPSAEERSLPLHIERDRDVIDSLAGLDHVLRRLCILLEVRRLQMGLESVGILVDFKQPHPCWIVLFEDRAEPPTSRLDADSGLAVLFDRGFERFELRRIDFELDDENKLSRYRIRRYVRSIEIATAMRQG